MSGNMSVVGVGVPHAKLVSMTKKLKVTDGQAPAGEKAQYHGGLCLKGYDLRNS